MKNEIISGWWSKIDFLIPKYFQKPNDEILTCLLEVYKNVIVHYAKRYLKYYKKRAKYKKASRLS